MRSCTPNDTPTQDTLSGLEPLFGTCVHHNCQFWAAEKDANSPRICEDNMLHAMQALRSSDLPISLARCPDWTLVWLTIFKG